MRPAIRNRTVLGVALSVCAVLAIGAALLMQRGPEPDLAPHMVPVSVASNTQIYVQVHEVTVAEWNRCNDEGACGLRLKVPFNDVEQDYPATGLSWVDATEYLNWISEATGHDFRLPTAEEWAFISAPVMPAKPAPIFSEPELAWASEYLLEAEIDRGLHPTGSYSVTDTGVADLDGNVWEWTGDCYAGAGTAITDGNCPAYRVGGVHEAVIAFLVRDPARGGCSVGAPPPHLGLRLVSDMALPAT